MRCLVVFLALVSSSNAQQTFDIVPGSGAQGWCKGFDMGPGEVEMIPTTAAECYDNCKAAHPTTVAVDFWDINHPGRNAGNICWCQDGCDSLAPSLPDGGDGVLYIAEGTAKGPSAGYNMYNIIEATAADGWCLGSDIKLTTEFNNHLQCFEGCRTAHGSLAADYFNRETGKDCFCQDICRCRIASKVGGGDGYLLIDETAPANDGLCHKMAAGIGTHGWCTGFDSGPGEVAATPTTAAECYDNCKAARPTTVAVDFWDINHPSRNDGNICWCQDACPCTEASKSDAGDGILFVATGTVKGASCGRNMKTVVEGNDNSICQGEMTAATGAPGNMYACANQCATDGFNVATYHTSGETACHCQMNCPCTHASDSSSGPGYLFVGETMNMPQMCDSTMTCGEVKDVYKDGSCCGNPNSHVTFR